MSSNRRDRRSLANLQGTGRIADPARREEDHAQTVVLERAHEAPIEDFDKTAVYDEGFLKQLEDFRGSKK